MFNPEWDATYMEVAYLISRHSKDPKYKVGCVIVNNENGAIVGLGYNGRGRGRPNERLSLETGKSGFAHAEMNAIARTSWEMKCEYTLYTTMAPCDICAALIINNPITRVVYAAGYPACSVGLDELRAHLGVEVVEHRAADAPAAVAPLELEAHWKAGFLRGAKFWYGKTNAGTMWQSEQNECWQASHKLWPSVRPESIEDARLIAADAPVLPTPMLWGEPVTVLYRGPRAHGQRWVFYQCADGTVGEMAEAEFDARQENA